MIQDFVRGIVQRTWAHRPLAVLYRRWYYRTGVERRRLDAWLESGRTTVPPATGKQLLVREFASRFGLRTLVETGTYLGLMIQGVRDNFERIYSIELDHFLAARAKRRFRRYAKISVLQGDSSEVLPRVLAKLEMPALFWLDAHYSGGITAGEGQGAPVIRELTMIFHHPIRTHVILIDDARLFGVDPAYPTIDAIAEYVRQYRPDFSMSVQSDVIRIHPSV